MAAYHGHAEVAEKLLKAGAIIDQARPVRSTYGLGSMEVVMMNI